jgi:hypothetical protein
MPEEGIYLLTHVGFTHNGEPTLSLEGEGKAYRFNPIGQTLSITVDKEQRHCTGWYDMRESVSYPCPESAAIDDKYDQCAACQQRTGFNPAFYNATSISTQQEERNQEPHILYLAHFGQGIVKVGISHAKRNRARLLEQGARTAVILDTFPTALIARQYEAQIAALPGIAETLQVRKKISAMQQHYDQVAAHQELRDAQARIESTIKTSFNASDPLSFHDTYFPSGIDDISSAIDTSDHALISGNVIGMVGPFLFCRYMDSTVFLPIKKYTGYQIDLKHSITDIPLPSQQMTFF